MAVVECGGRTRQGSMGFVFVQSSVMGRSPLLVAHNVVVHRAPAPATVPGLMGTRTVKRPKGLANAEAAASTSAAAVMILMLRITDDSRQAFGRSVEYD